jgi:hypothetical protein
MTQAFLAAASREDIDDEASSSCCVGVAIAKDARRVNTTVRPENLVMTRWGEEKSDLKFELIQRMATKKKETDQTSVVYKKQTTNER